MGLIDRFRNAWNVFKNKDPTWTSGYGPGYGLRPDRMRFSRGNERSIITSVFNKIAIDVAAIPIKHVKVDEEGRYKEDVKDDLNNCLNLEANIDQTGRAFIQDAVQSMFDEGCVALVPTDTDDEPEDSGNFAIYTMRTGRVVEWYPEKVRVNVYNEHTGIGRKDVVVAEVDNEIYYLTESDPDAVAKFKVKFTVYDPVTDVTPSTRTVSGVTTVNDLTFE